MKTLRRRIPLLILIALAVVAYVPNVIDLLTPAQVYVDRNRATLEARWQIIDVVYVPSIDAFSVFYVSESNAAGYAAEAVQVARLITASGNLPIKEININPTDADGQALDTLRVLYADVLLFRQGKISKEELVRRIT